MLTSHPTDYLKSLRAHLFEEVNKCDLVPPSIKGLPLINRRDTPLRPVAKVLSEATVQCKCVQSFTTITYSLLIIISHFSLYHIVTFPGGQF